MTGSESASMADHSFGDVVLVSFPFTDQSGAKKRPAVVVSSRAYNQSKPDIVIMALTGRIRTPLGLGEAMVADWQDAGLIKASVFKPVFSTIEQSLVTRRMGELSPADLRTLREILALTIG